MKPLLRVTLITIGTILPIFLPVLSGCGNSVEEEIIKSQPACIEPMQKIPADYDDFEFWDVEALRSYPDLKDMYQVWYERKTQYLEERYGLNTASIRYMAQGDGLLSIYKIDYDIKALRNKIQIEYYRDTDYPDMEVWKSRPSNDPQSVTGGWVLTEGLIVRGSNNGNVDDYLRVASGEEPSMYNDGFAKMLERLPLGIMTGIIRSSYPEGTMITGMAVNKEADGALKWTNIFEFESTGDRRNSTIEDIYNDLENDFNEAESEFAKRGESPPFKDLKLERDGDVITMSCLVEERYMITLLFFG